MAEPYPTPAEVADIAATADPILRNYRITTGYWRISRAFRQRVPGGANWCAFGTWASRQAGCSIRKEDVQRTVARKLRARLEQRPILLEVHQALRIPESRIARLAGELSQGLPGIDRTADALARGNQQIFGEIGDAFVRYMDGRAAGGASFATSLRPGPPPAGQDLLRTAFGYYATAEQEHGHGARAQLILLANLQIAYHEQTMAQPLVREAMDASLLDIRDIRRTVLARIEEMLEQSPLGAVRTGIGNRLINQLADELSEELRSIVRLVITDRLMSIELPGERMLRLGTDITADFPPSLVSLSHRDLVTQLAALDPSPASTVASRSVDWSVLADRMHYLADFFRCYQEDDTLFDAPFSDEAIANIEAARLPAGGV